MDKVTFNCEIITPMFCGDADNTEAELRAPSLKGALRYWWRTIYGGRYDSLDVLQAAEKQVFGLAAGEKGTASSFAIQIIHDGKGTIDPLPKVPGKAHSSKNISINEMDYLAYGPINYVKGQGQVVLRKYLSPGTKFTVILRFRSPQYKEEVINSFRAVAWLGGLGSKSRNGFGRFSIGELPDIVKLLKPFVTGKPKDYLTVNQRTTLFKVNASNPAYHIVQGSLGKIYRELRQLVEGRRYTGTRRQYIAAPLMEKGRPMDGVITDSQDRKAKSLFLTVVKNSNNYEGYVLYLYGTAYFPSNRNVNMKQYEEVQNMIVDKLGKQESLKRVNI